MVIGFKENGKFQLKTWQTTVTSYLVIIWVIFKSILFISKYRQAVLEDPDHKVSTPDNLDDPSWWFITLLCTTFLDLYLTWGLICIEEEKESENTALNDVRVETDEEKRPLFEPNITNIDERVRIWAGL